MEFGTLFFDLDGTLIDSRQRLYALFCDLTSDAGLGFDEYWSEKRAKKSNQWILKEKFGYSECMAEQFQKDWMRRIEENRYLDMDTVFPDTVDCLNAFSDHCDLFLVSARQSSRKAHEQLDRLGISHFFKEVLITEQKQSKEKLIHSLGLKLNRDNAAIVGDTGEETLAGKSLGIFTVSTLTGFRNRDVLTFYRPDLIVDNLAVFGRRFAKLA